MRRKRQNSCQNGGQGKSKGRKRERTDEPYGFELDALGAGLAEPGVLSDAGSEHGAGVAGLERDDKLHAVDGDEGGIFARGHLVG